MSDEQKVEVNGALAPEVASPPTAEELAEERKIQWAKQRAEESEQILALVHTDLPDNPNLHDRATQMKYLNAVANLMGSTERQIQFKSGVLADLREEQSRLNPVEQGPQTGSRIPPPIKKVKKRDSEAVMRSDRERIFNARRNLKVGLSMQMAKGSMQPKPPVIIEEVHDDAEMKS